MTGRRGDARPWRFPRNWRWPRSFSARLALATSTLIVGACLVLSLILVRSDVAEIQNSLMDRGQTLSAFLARESELSVLSGNLDGLRQLAAVAHAQHDVSYCRFFDANGNLLVSVGDDLTATPAVLPRADADASVSKSAEVWEFLAPVLTTLSRPRGEELEFPDDRGAAGPQGIAAQERVGSVAIGLALASLHEHQRATFTTAAFFTVLVASLAMFSAALFARALTRPLRALAGAADAIAQGDLSTVVAVTTHDEVASVAVSFNAMVQSLAENRKKIEEYSQTLEVRSAHLEVLNRDLEEANRLKSEFLGQVSHELRTPLNVIIGYAQMLSEEAEGPINAVQRELVAAIDRYSRAQLDLVTDVLDLSRLASGQVSLHIERFMLAAALADIPTLHNGSTDKPNVTLTVDLAADLPELETDRVKLQAIVSNLIDNAVKFTEAGSVVVAAHCEDPGHVIIDVCDTGPGIAPQDVERIFDEFHQLGQSSTRATHGVGLGLSIVKRLTAALGGTVSVSSRVGEGSVFRLEIPTHLVSVDAALLLSAANH